MTRRRPTPCSPSPLVVGASFAYLLLLFAVAAYGDARSRSGRSIIGNAWVYALSMAVYCTAWTYFGSVGRAASAGVWFLPIYLGPTLAMVLAWMMLRKMIRIAKTYRITSIADFIASRYGKSPLLAGAGDPDHRRRHRALHRPAAQGHRQRLCPADHAARHAARRAARLVARQHASTSRSRWPASPSCSAPGTSTAPNARRHGRGDRLRVGRQAARLPGGRRVRDLGPLRRTGRHLRARPRRRPSCTSCSRLDPGAGPAIRLRAVVRADPAVDALGRLPAAPVPDDGGRERRRAASAPRGLGVPALPAADQPVRPADRLGRPAALRARPDGRRQLRPLAAAGRWASRGWRCSPSSAGCRRPPAW